MDMSLPVLDGWEATRQLKAAPETARHPGHRADRARHGRATGRRRSRPGCDDYDTKPVDLPRLLEKIRDKLGASDPPR